MVAVGGVYGQITLPPPGIINTVAGDGTGGYSGDGGLATRAEISDPFGVAVDSAGNIYIADYLNHRIRKVSASTGDISTVAGNGTEGSSGYGGPATSAELYWPTGVAVDSADNIYIADEGNDWISKVTASTGIITVVAGTGALGYSGDGGLATSAKLNEPSGVALDGSANIYLADKGNNRIRRVTVSTGIITTVAGDGVAGYSGDGGLATSAELNAPWGVAVTGGGDIFIADYLNYRVRKVTKSTSIITTFAGDGVLGYSGDGGAATSAELGEPTGVAVGGGNVYIADYYNNRVRVVNESTGIITTAAGDGIKGYAGDGGVATGAELDWPWGVAVDISANLYIADSLNNRIRVVGSARNPLPSGSGLITTVAGNGTAGYSGDGGAATSAELDAPGGVAVDSSDDIFIADYLESRIRKVTASTGIISTVAGNGTEGYSGDGGAATSAELYYPLDVAVDASANVYIADEGNCRVRAVNTGTKAVTIAGVTIQPGDIATVAGDGTCGYSGDGAAATKAELYYPTGVAVDASGNIYIADYLNYRIRKVTASTGIISTFAGDGIGGYSGDNGPATSAEIDCAEGVRADSAFNVYIADTCNDRIRIVAAYTGIITTLAGNGKAGYAGDGGSADLAEFYDPVDVAVDALGNVYVADEFNDRVRAVSSARIYTDAGDGTVGFSGDGGAATNAELDDPRGVAVDASGDIYIGDTGNHRVRKVGVAPTFYPATGTYTGAQLISITSSSPGAVIYYTTNGTTPTTASSVYSSPILVAATETVKAISLVAGFATSAVGTASYTISGGTAAATPTFSPAAGSYTGTENVTLGDTTAGATIYFTTNGATPTTSSNVYYAPFAVSTTETVKAIAVAVGGASSAVGSAAYTIVSATPAFSPAAGTYTGAQSVTITDAASPATIYYTTNGTTPTTSSPVYSGPIQVSATETVEAIAVSPGESTSAVGSAKYTINSGTATATPTFSPAAGTYTGTQSVTISDSTSGAVIYYTTNGTTPTASSPVYSGPVIVDATETIEAIGIAHADSSSAVGSAKYTINAGTKAATPTFSPAAGSYTGSQKVTISDSTSGSTIFYTTNGTTPTTASSVYSGAIPVTATETIEALATAPGDSASAVASGTYTISGGTATATPTFSPVAGAYNATQKVTISDSTSGAAIYYTINGTTPTTSSQLYTGAITVSATQTVAAIAVANGSTTSAVGSGLYTIALPAATPTFSPAPGSFDGTQTVTISDTTSGAAIFYSISGGTPVLYSGPITVSVSETLNAFAVATGGSQSANASGAYIITTCTQ